MPITNSLTIKPFIRWAGGKTWLVDDLSNSIKFPFNNYHEPFLGSGALFIRLKSLGKINNYAYLNDLNSDLINSFTQIKNNPSSVFRILETYKNDKDFYYELRDRIPENKAEKAAKFIFLNRTCFNGLYRVNLNGNFNVPYGNKKYKRLFEYNNFTKVHKLLRRKVFLTSNDFFFTLNNVKKNDLVFIDPPYTVNHEHNGFVRYNEKIFSWEDQIRLKEFIQKIIEKHAFFILTNAAHKSIYKLFGEISEPMSIERPSLIGGKKAVRGIIHEYVFSNCI